MVDKYKKSGIRKYGIFSGERYILVFSTAKGNKAFTVSEFSFAHYKLREKGTLKYKGDKIIEFR